MNQMQQHNVTVIAFDTATLSDVEAVLITAARRRAAETGDRVAECGVITMKPYGGMAHAYSVQMPFAVSVPCRDRECGCEVNVVRGEE